MATDAELLHLECMDCTTNESIQAVKDEILRLWDMSYGHATYNRGWLRLITGGWSDNEDILEHIPAMFHSVAWERSVRGGMHVYRVPKLASTLGRKTR